jgi:hypothetical protein
MSEMEQKPEQKSTAIGIMLTVAAILSLLLVSLSYL